MNIGIVPLHREHIDKLFEGNPHPDLARQSSEGYLSPGSVACCLLSNGEPVFAGGIVNMLWKRGEAWMLPTPFFRSHVKTCIRELYRHLPVMAQQGGFVRVQATCVQGISGSLFRHLGFHFEGTMAKFGPFGETCSIYARIFEEDRGVI